MPKGTLIDPLEEIPSLKSSFLRAAQTTNTEEEIEAKRTNEDGLIDPLIILEKDKSPEEKIYIILYHINSDDEDSIESNTFSVCIGRTMAYTDIKTKLTSGLDIDVRRSKVITETKQTCDNGDEKYFLMPFNECVSIYAFCTYAATFFNDEDEFNINDYDYEESETTTDQSLNVKSFFTKEQMDYRKILQESFNRQHILENLMSLSDNNDSHNV